ncbi:MAG: hypothetical protein Q4G43_04070 [Mobilicoccus sp.]|nr:hypothetical protein [Mobilicoccus sp.]
MSESTGAVVPADESGQRSTSALGRAVVADALRSVAPAAAAAAAAEENWRSGYPRHFRGLVEHGLSHTPDAVRIAADGLASLAARWEWQDAGSTRPLRDVFDGATAGPALATEVVEGQGAPERELSVPYRGRRLTGSALRDALEDWVERGIVEPDTAAAVGRVASHPEWLGLPGRTTVVLGASSEMGPLRSLLRWGADVAALDLPRPDLWSRLLTDVRRYAGRMHVPTQPRSTGVLARRAGVDILHDLPRVATWIDGLDGRLVLGNYVYGDGVVNLRLSGATDALAVHLMERREDCALAYLATPTDVFAVPREAVRASRATYEHRRGRLLTAGVRTLSRDALYRPGYPGVPDPGRPGITDCIVPQQGPNYLLAKRIHRWRATDARTHGRQVSFAVAPPTRTRSVLKNRALAAAYAGAHRFGVEVFEPATANTLMAALLVHDLHVDRSAGLHPWEHEATHAAHGGLWRTGYDPRSVLGIAAVTGVLSRH